MIKVIYTEIGSKVGLSTGSPSRCTGITQQLETIGSYAWLRSYIFEPFSVESANLRSFMKDFYELFISELKEIYATEKSIVKILPSVIKTARSQKLKEAITQHMHEGEAQIKRLEQIFSELKESHTNARCIPIEGLIEEWKHVKKAHYHDDVQDAAIIGFLQKIEHYEIASYGTLRTFAKHLNLASIEVLLKESAKEEGAADKKLTDIAEGSLFTSGINAKACKKKVA